MKSYFDIALGSCYELFASADTLKDGIILSNEHFQEIYTRVDNVTSQLGGFKRSIK